VVGDPVVRRPSILRSRIAVLRRFVVRALARFRRAPLEEEVRDSWGLRAFERLEQDIRFALRGFRRAPAFVATVVLTIALALGLNTAVFTVFNAYVLRPLAIRDGTSLYEAFFPKRLTWRQYQEVRALPVVAESFAYAVAFARSDTRPMFGNVVTGDAFRVLGAVPVLGRLLVPEDAKPPVGQPVMVLSYDAWQGKFGGDTAVVGKLVRVRGIALTVIGVASKQFTGFTSVPPDFWAPATLLSRLTMTDDPFGAKEPPTFRPVIRLKPGVNTTQAAAVLEAWAQNETAPLPDSLRWRRVDLESLTSALPLTNETVAIFAPAVVAFGLVLLIACANVANVMLARGIARQREIGIRLALGADRRRLIRQLLTESVLLAVPAAVLGFFISAATIDLGVRVMFASAPAEYAPYLRTIPLSPDLRVFGFVLVAAFASALAFGLVPALQATRPDVVRAARGDFDAATRTGRVRASLVVAQIGVSTLLLIVTGILVRGADSVGRLEPGFRTRDVVEFTLDDRARSAAVRYLRAAHSVTDVGASTHAPLDGAYETIGVRPSGEQRIETPGVDFVDAGFFRVLDLPILRGRPFSEADERETAAVAIVNEAAARVFWPARDPIGQLLTLSADPPRESRLARVRTARVVGVTRNAVSGWLGTGRDRPVIYFPTSADSAGTEILVRVVGDASAARERLDRELAVIDAGAVYETHPLASYLAVQRWPFQIFSWLSSAIGAIALILTLIGTYGVLSYLVAQRSREIGVRMALGASVAAVVGLVVRQSFRYAAVGLAAGTFVALGVSRLVASQLVVVNMFDAAGYAFGVSAVLLACGVAAWAPSRRAARVDPVKVLRAD